MTDRELPFPAALLPAGASLLPLDSLGVIRVRGPAARDFLQGQLTHDTRLLSAQRGQLTGYCNPKGRLLAVFTAQQLAEDDFALTLPAELLPATLQRLRMFVLRSPVQLSDDTAAWTGRGLIGPAAAAVLQRQGLPVPAGDWDTASQEGLRVLRRPGPVPRFELWGTPAVMADWQAQAALPPAPDWAWPLAEVASALPQGTAATREHFVPQMIDLDHDGVSFTKGCYPGQEIVARVHYLGRIKQRLFWAEADAPANPGCEIRAEGHDQPVGTVMAAAARPTGGALLAVSLQIEQAHASLVVAGEPPLSLRGLCRVHPAP